MKVAGRELGLVRERSLTAALSAAFSVKARGCWENADVSDVWKAELRPHEMLRGKFLLADCSQEQTGSEKQKQTHDHLLRRQR